MKRRAISPEDAVDIDECCEPQVKKVRSKKVVDSKPLSDHEFPRKNLWKIEEELQLDFGVSLDVSFNICRLLDEGNSIPFIARYRREQTAGMEPETLRHFKDSFENYQAVQEKCKKSIAAVAKLGKLTESVRNSFCAAKTMDEIDIAYTPFKSSAKTSLAERARATGLGDLAEGLLSGTICSIDIASIIDSQQPGKANKIEVEKSIQYIIADTIVYNKDFATFLKEIQKKASLTMEVKEGKPKGKSDKETKKKTCNETDPRKFELYHDFSKPVKFLQSHQVLAINRGESLKFLSVKINVPDWVLHQVEKQVRSQWLQKGLFSKYRTDMVQAAVKDAYKRLMCPQIIRNCRSELTKMAENEAIDNFAKNLANLLMMPPYRGQKILSIDPGFSHGCKIAVISANGDVLDTDVVYPKYNANGPPDPKASLRLQSLVCKHEVETIAIGNGTACRETENLVDSAIQSGQFHPLKVQYVIVDERGASIYSCTDIAKKEFPKLDTNLISAVSLGRRLQDPLSEYVKIEPHHLGCGMYQHDVKQAKLKSALDETVIECVSFVGVNVNACSEHLLKRVAGLNAARAKAIIEYRKKNGDFVSRIDLKKVKGIGEKVFEQCAGFIRVHSDDVSKRVNESKALYNPLDATNIHPESYAVTSKLIKKAKVELTDIGSQRFKQRLQSFLSGTTVDTLATTLNVGVPTLNLIIESLEKGLCYDLRETMDGPIFKSGMTRIEDTKVGSILTGRVTNVTAFGAFVDIGLGRNGLLHVSKMRGARVELGNRVQVKLISRDVDRGKLGLELIKTL